MVKYSHEHILYIIQTYKYIVCIHIFTKLICFVMHTMRIISALIIIHFVTSVPHNSRNVQASGVHVPRVLPLVESLRTFHYIPIR